MRRFYMVWVAGRGSPTVMYNELEAALERAEALRREHTGREVYVLAPTHRIDGRPMGEIVDGCKSKNQPVAPAIRVKKRRRLPTLAG